MTLSEKLPELTSVLCERIDALQKDMPFLLNLRSIAPKPAVHLYLDFSDNTLGYIYRMVSLIQLKITNVDIVLSNFHYPIF